MKASQPDRGTIRQYLLGRVNDQEDLESNISETILMDDDFSALVESVEDEIVEEYVEGTLNPADRLAADNYFLAPAERKERLQFERLLRNCLEKREPSFSERRLESSPEKNLGAVSINNDAALVVQRKAYQRSFYSALAALFVVVASGLGYVSELRTKQLNLEHELTQQQNQVGRHAQEASLSSSSLLALTLVAERARGGVDVPQLDIKGETQRIVVELALPDPASVSYEIALESQGGTPVWKATLLPIVSASGDARLVFDVPGKLLAPGHYSFGVTTLSPTNSRHSYYDFDVKLSR